MFRFLISKTFFINLLIAIVLGVAIVWITISQLNAYTRHGHEKTVPSVKNIPKFQAIHLLESENLKYKIIDSTYVADQPPGVVLDQDPKPEAKAKEGRTVYLTVNTLQPPEVQIPHLLEASERFAINQLQILGLKTKVDFKPHPWQVVVDIKVDGERVKPGDVVTKGTEVTLVIGSGLGTELVQLPNLEGMTFEEAEQMLLEGKLNAGRLRYDTTVNDSSSAIIYRTFPLYKPQNPPMVREGYTVDLYFTQSNKNSIWNRYNSENDSLRRIR